MAGLLDHDVVVVDFEDADVVFRTRLFDAAAARHLVEGDLLLHHFVGGGVDEVFSTSIFFSICRTDLSTRSGPVRTTIVNLWMPASADSEVVRLSILTSRLGENCGDLVQQTHLVFRKYSDDILLFFHSRSGFTPAGSSATGAPAGPWEIRCLRPRRALRAGMRPRQACISADGVRSFLAPLDAAVAMPLPRAISPKSGFFISVNE